MCATSVDYAIAECMKYGNGFAIEFIGDNNFRISEMYVDGRLSKRKKVNHD